MSEKSSATSEIMRLMGRGASNDQLLSYLCFQEPWLRAHPVSEIRQFANHTKNHVAFDKKAYEDLMNLIRVNRSNYNQELKHRKLIDDAIGETDVLLSMADIEEQVTRRITSGYYEIDKVFGSSRRYDSDGSLVREDYGIPLGKIHLLAGEEGVGKTRFCIEEAIRFTEDMGLTVLVFQKEMSLGEFKETLMNSYRANDRKPSENGLRKLIVRKDRNYQDCCRLIKQIKPALVIFDSYNLLHNSKTEQGIEDIVFFVKEAIGDHTACWMLAHLNQRGVIKGNNHIRYLVDGTFVMQWATEPENEDERNLYDVVMRKCKKNPFEGRYKMFSEKNRGGKRHVTAFLQHDGPRILVLPEKNTENFDDNISDE